MRRKVFAAAVPLAALWAASVVAVGLSKSGYVALGATVSLGAAWIALVYRREILHRGDRAGDYVIGLSSERHVQHELAPLESRCFVRHDLPLRAGGNIDHVVCGPTGAFAIETKTTAYRRTDLVIARRRAKWLSTKLDNHWVTPVICLSRRDGEPFERDRVWIVPASDLRAWLEGRRDRPVDPVFALRALRR